jgi:hypothetical protein
MIKGEWDVLAEPQVEGICYLVEVRAGNLKQGKHLRN